MRVIQVKPVHASISASSIADGFLLNNPHRFMVSSVDLFITPCNHLIYFEYTWCYYNATRGQPPSVLLNFIPSVM
jgi:hypothetical protein